MYTARLSRSRTQSRLAWTHTHKPPRKGPEASLLAHPRSSRSSKGHSSPGEVRGHCPPRSNVLILKVLIPRGYKTAQLRDGEETDFRHNPPGTPKQPGICPKAPRRPRIFCFSRALSSPPSPGACYRPGATCLGYFSSSHECP